MNFKQLLASYVLGHQSISELPDIALIGLKEGFESESLVILAGLSKSANTFQIEEYLMLALSELDIEIFTTQSARIVVLKYYLQTMIEDRDCAYNAMMTIDNNIYRLKRKDHIESKDEKYIGQELGLEHLFTWYRELQDWNAGSRPSYYGALSKEEQKIKYTGHLVEEAKVLLQKLDL